MLTPRSLERRVQRILRGTPPQGRRPIVALGAVAVLATTPIVTWAVTPGEILRRSASTPTAQVHRDVGVDTLAEGPIFDALVRTLADPEPEVRRSAVNSLRNRGDTRSLGALHVVLQDPDDDVRLAAAAALGLRPPSRNLPLSALSAPPAADVTVIDSLSGLLEHPESDRRLAAVRRLGNLRDSRATPALVARLGDADHSVREAAVSALGNLRDPDTWSALVERLGDPRASVRERAASALGNLRDRRAVPALVSAWPDPDGHVRASVAGALGAIGDPRGVPVLIEAIDDDVVHVRGVAAEALGKVGAQRPAGAAGVTWTTETIGTHACESRRSTRFEGDLPRAVSTLLEDADAERRERAAYAIGALAGSRDSFVSVAGVDAGAKDHHHALIAALSDPAEGVRIAAACSLAVVGDARALEGLRMRTGESEPDALRAAARAAIARILEREGDGS